MPLKNTDIVASIDNRFANLIIDLDRVYRLLGRPPIGNVAYEDSEQSNARRELLHVEKVAIKNKIVDARTDANFTDKVSDELHHSLVRAVARQIDNSDYVFNELLGLDDNVVGLLDNLFLRATTISKIESFITEIAWLKRDVLALVNSPAYKRVDKYGRTIKVESIRTALSFFGVENLHLILPMLILRFTLPQITDPYPRIKQKLWMYSHGVANSCKVIAERRGVKPAFAFTLGALSEIGGNAVTKLYFKLFDQLHRSMLETTQLNKNRETHAALLKIQPSIDSLISVQRHYADSLTADIFEHMALKRVPIAGPMRALVDHTGEFSEMVETLQQARRYAKVRLLNKHRLIEPSESKNYLKVETFPDNSLILLKEMALFELKLHFE